MSVLLKYFNVTLSIVRDVPKIKFIPKPEYVVSAIPKRPNTNISYSPSQREYYSIFGDGAELDLLYEERKKLFPPTKLLEWYKITFNTTPAELALIDSHMLNIKNNIKTGLNTHYSSAAGEITREKLRSHKKKWSPIVGRLNKDRWQNDEWRSREMARRKETNHYERSSVTAKQTYANPEFKEKFIKIANESSRIEKIREASKNFWKNPDYVKKVLGQTRNKNVVINNIPMNSVEAIVASKLTERRVAWEYELPIHTDKKTYLPDFTINKNIIIEVFGDFWHATPKVYDSSDIIYSKITAGEIWARDANKKEVLEKLGYRVYILWQDDIINSPHILEELINGIC